jgi:enamine deaminase RidA (YjgF/YER057c/UK114 family)
MERPQFIMPPAQAGGYSQAVRIGERVETAGQGGWTATGEFAPELRDEIAQAFENLSAVLAAAGATWEHVVAVNSYHMPVTQEACAIMGEQFAARMPRHAPIWTCTSVPSFGLPGMRVEIRVTAIITGDN